MYAIAIFVAVIALSWAAIAHRSTAQRSDVKDVEAKNKPSGDDTEPNEPKLELSRTRSRSREKVHEADGLERTDPEPEQDHDHIQYLDHPSIRLMLAQAEEKRAEKEREHTRRQLEREEAHRDLKGRTAATERKLFRKRERERELER